MLNLCLLGMQQRPTFTLFEVPCVGDALFWPESMQRHIILWHAKIPPNPLFLKICNQPEPPKIRASRAEFAKP